MVEMRAPDREPVQVSVVWQGRDFQLWSYSVSHGHLLIRSPKDEQNPLNLDLMFAGLEYLDAPRCLPGLQLGESTPEEVVRAQDRLGRQVDKKHMFILVSNGRRFLAVAAALKVIESAMDIFESPF